jgi:hypothetical protein
MRGQIQVAADTTPEKLSPVLLNGGIVQFKISLDSLGKIESLPEI